MTDYREIIPSKALRKFDELCLRNKYLHQNKELQQQILVCMADMLQEAANDKNKIYAAIFESLIQSHYKEKARKGAVARDKKYRQFREKFAEIQKEKYLEMLQVGCRFTANNFVKWFLANKADEMQIPYVEQNKRNKLTQLAQENNRKFKKLLLG